MVGCNLRARSQNGGERPSSGAATIEQAVRSRFYATIEPHPDFPPQYCIWATDPQVAPHQPAGFSFEYLAELVKNSLNLMPEFITGPTRITAAGNKPKIIEEFIGRVNSREARLSIAHMRSPGGWVEPGQRPEFDEFTLVLKGMLRVRHGGGTLEVKENQAIHTKAGEWVEYSSPLPEGADYIAVCLPAFSPDTVHRDLA
jgi:mannose-6-phosphate isomerase-like protein (cupin superfamily)